MPFEKSANHTEALLKVLLKIIERTAAGGATKRELRETYAEVKGSPPHDRTISRIVTAINEYISRWEDDGSMILQTSTVGGRGFNQAVEVRHQDKQTYYYFTRDLTEHTKTGFAQAAQAALSLYPQKKQMTPEHFEAVKDAFSGSILRRMTGWDSLEKDIERFVHVSGYSRAKIQQVGQWTFKILDALRRSKRIEFDYVRLYDGTDSRQRQLEPYGLVCRQGTWYVVGRDVDKGEKRVFRIDQIVRLSVVENSTYSVPAGFSMQEAYGNAWGVWTEAGAGQLEQVVIRVDAGMAAKFRTTRYHDSQQLVSNADGSTEILFNVTGVEEMVPWLITWGKTIEVLQPDWLRGAVAATARDIAAVYDKAGERER